MDATATPATDPASYFCERITGMRCERCGEPAVIEWCVFTRTPLNCWFCDACSVMFHALLDSGEITVRNACVGRRWLDSGQLVTQHFWPGIPGAKAYRGILWEWL